MSVWVEMFSSGKTQQGAFVTLHVSVWVEIIISEKMILWKSTVTLHVSVWVEIQCYFKEAYPDEESRSTWACELKCLWFGKGKIWGERHAPRERVSWNVFPSPVAIEICPVTLHVSVWVEICYHITHKRLSRSRSTWACELKSFLCYLLVVTLCHAPRERVSWNILIECLLCALIVTLHVSVWVEIY